MQEADFHEVADEFINLANELSEDWAMPFLSAVFMYAAARYNAHFFYETDGSAVLAPLFWEGGEGCLAIGLAQNGRRR